MVHIERRGPDVAGKDDKWPVRNVTPGLMTQIRQTRMGEVLDFPPDTYLLVPTGTGRYYRDMVVTGALPMVWNHQSRDFLMQENLPHLHESPLANCLTVFIVPDPGHAEREAAQREAAARRAASRRATNQRALQRARARQTAGAPPAAASRAASLPAAASPAAFSPAATFPAAVPFVAAPLVAAPLVAAPLAVVYPAAAPLAPAPVAAALGVPALVAPAGGAPNSHDQVGNGEPVEGSRAWWDSFVSSDVTSEWWEEEDRAEAERQSIPIIFLD
ncbi:uncharacterized protein EAE98_000866 [Botrytis deweyae]|uniref:Uncharacterized protein n=1 Tax=Botrytis deweyae TaxID=2478750 RepID=A0ABQ7IZV1_9HELO|nr:uncharacterized protein EAE98_000866 [Botrytis deweyae]KAF7938528.1 hypothetical protein EAE98_000866 [Botrytis deweyae]